MSAEAAPSTTIPLKRLITAMESGVSVNAIDSSAAESEFGVLKTSCVYTGRFDSSENKTVLAEEYSRVACPVRAGSLVVSRMNTPDLVGATGYVNKDEPTLFLPDRLWQVSVDRTRAVPKFVYWWTQSNLYRDQVRVACAGTSSSMQNLDQDSFRSFSVPRLPLCQQDRIANFLDEQTARIDALIAEKERIVTSLKDFDEVTAFDLATRGTAPLAERTAYPEPWLTGVPAHWKLSKLRYLTHIGNGSTPKRDNAEYWEGGSVPWLNSGSVTGSRVCEPSDLVTESARKQCHLPMVRQGSTLVALTGQGKTRGSAALLEFDSTINQHLAYLSSFDKALTDEYLWVALTGFYSVLRYISDDGGSTKGALTCEQLSHLRIPIPPLGEQSRIVSEYKSKTLAVAQLLANVWKHINRLREYRSSLISATVTGQLNIDEFQARQLEVA